MIELQNIDLRGDPDACLYVKEETVEVVFAREDGEIMSLEGANRYRAGDALITGSTGSAWCVSRDRFDEKYEPVSPLRHGEEGNYRNRPIPVLAKRMDEAFSIVRSQGGDRLEGAPGDWLMQYSPGDYGVTKHSRFVEVYNPVGTSR
ncbi:MAG: hypothetical protein B7X10_02535 [Burkholderiales bacterium 21-58-4]|nr:MAG: hypothetical protein B7X10_02535 [Burkholderiales bacterium 21-58-4]HQT25916.1 PGDYG domain-containing protein [Burkholderiales bacterium]